MFDGVAVSREFSDNIVITGDAAMHAIVDLFASLIVAMAAAAFAHLGLTLEAEPRKQEPVVERTIDRRDPAAARQTTASAGVVTPQSRPAQPASQIC